MFWGKLTWGGGDKNAIGGYKGRYFILASPGAVCNAGRAVLAG